MTGYKRLGKEKEHDTVAYKAGVMITMCIFTNKIEVRNVACESGTRNIAIAQLSIGTKVCSKRI
jgi:hypothetical protein